MSFIRIRDFFKTRKNILWLIFICFNLLYLLIKSTTDYFKTEYLYPNLDTDIRETILIFALITAFFVFVILVNNKLTTKKSVFLFIQIMFAIVLPFFWNDNSKFIVITIYFVLMIFALFFKERWIKVFYSFCSIIITLLYVLYTSFLGIWISNSLCSNTADLENYLIVDEEIASEYTDFFPKREKVLYDYASGETVYYNYKLCRPTILDVYGTYEINLYYNYADNKKFESDKEYISSLGYREILNDEEIIIYLVSMEKTNFSVFDYRYQYIIVNSSYKTIEYISNNNNPF